MWFRGCKGEAFYLKRLTTVKERFLAVGTPAALYLYYYKVFHMVGLLVTLSTSALRRAENSSSQHPEEKVWKIYAFFFSSFLKQLFWQTLQLFPSVHLFFIALVSNSQLNTYTILCNYTLSPQRVHFPFSRMKSNIQHVFRSYNDNEGAPCPSVHLLDCLRVCQKWFKKKKLIQFYRNSRESYCFLLLMISAVQTLFFSSICLERFLN